MFEPQIVPTSEVLNAARNTVTKLNRAEIEKAVEPIIRKSLRELEFTQADLADADFATHTNGMFRPDVRRVSLIISLLLSALEREATGLAAPERAAGGLGGEATDLAAPERAGSGLAALGQQASGEGLEVGSAFGYLLFSAAVLFPRMGWTGLDYPGRSYRHPEAYEKAYREYGCEFVEADICKERLPFADGKFSVVTFSEVLEHLPVERVGFVFSELARVVRPGGILVVSSPNQASLENRLKLLKGKSILEMPNPIDSLGGVFGHIRLYTPGEVEATLLKLGFGLEASRIETNVSGFRGTAKSWRRRMYRLYERVEGGLGVLRGLGDTYYLSFRKEGRKEGRSADLIV
jgi:SAM-dependent methyltransferase